MENLFDLLDLGGNVWKKRIHDGLPRGVPALGCISPLLAYFGTGLTVSSRPIHRSLLAKYTIVTTPEVTETLENIFKMSNVKTNVTSICRNVNVLKETMENQFLNV